VGAYLAHNDSAAYAIQSSVVCMIVV